MALCDKLFIYFGDNYLPIKVKILIKLCCQLYHKGFTNLGLMRHSHDTTGELENYPLCIHNFIILLQYIFLRVSHYGNVSSLRNSCFNYLMHLN